jgi:hypothetical protein
MKKPAQEIEGQDAKITQGELWLLRRDAYKLQCLENAGVDNTQAYEEGMREFHQSDDYGDPDYRR